MNKNIDISQEEFEAIEPYLLQQMTEKEESAFTEKLATDLSFQHKLDTARLLFVAVQEAALEKELDVFHKNLLSLKKNPAKISGKVASINRWLVAASVVFIVGLISLFILNLGGNEEKLFASYYQQEPGLISSMGATDNYLFNRAMVDYKVGEYDAALQTWESLLVSKPANDTLNYFIGSAYMGKGNDETAISYFQKVIINENSFFRNDALWYTGLALIREKKMKEAIPFLEKAEHPDKEQLLPKLKEKG